MKAVVIKKYTVPAEFEYDGVNYNSPAPVMSYVLNDKIACIFELFLDVNGNKRIATTRILGNQTYLFKNRAPTGLFETDQYYIITVFEVTPQDNGAMTTVSYNALIIDKQTFECSEIQLHSGKPSYIIIPVLNDFKNRCVVVPLNETGNFIYGEIKVTLSESGYNIVIEPYFEIPAEGMSDIISHAIIYAVKDDYCKKIYLVYSRLYEEGWTALEHLSIASIKYDTQEIVKEDGKFTIDGKDISGGDGVVIGVKEKIDTTMYNDILYMNINGLKIPCGYTVIPQACYDRYIIRFPPESQTTKITQKDEVYLIYEVLELVCEETQNNIWNQILLLLEILLYVSVICSILKSVSEIFKQK